MSVAISTRKNFTRPEGMGRRLAAAMLVVASAALLVVCANFSGNAGFTGAAYAGAKAGAGSYSAAWTLWTLSIGDRQWR